MSLKPVLKSSLTAKRRFFYIMNTTHSCYDIVLTIRRPGFDSQRGWLLFILLVTKIILILEVHGEKLSFLFFSMILHVFLSRPLQGQNLKKIYGTQKWQKTMGNFRREFREHRKISVDRLCSFGIYYLVSSAWASSIFEKSLYLFIILILINSKWT